MVTYGMLGLKTAMVGQCIQFWFRCWIAFSTRGMYVLFQQDVQHMSTEERVCER